jgi:hypothetical protein
MRKFLYILGALTVIILVVGAVGVGVVVYNGRALDAESKTFIDTAVPAIATNWSEDALLERATPELRGSVTPDQLRTLFEGFSRLGRLVEYQGSKGDANMSYIAGVGGSVSALYVATAKFQNGDAVFRITLLKRNGQWLIHNFHVDPAPNGQVEQHASTGNFTYGGIGVRVNLSRLLTRAP